MGAMINSAIHVLMYSYYTMALLGTPHQTRALALMVPRPQPADREAGVVYFAAAESPFLMWQGCRARGSASSRKRSCFSSACA
jgi:hypothetical protein